jgi:glycine oxidase
MRQPDVLIIGGGVIGCAVAYALARDASGAVTLVERTAIGSGASGAAAGVLAVASNRAPRGVLFDLRRRSAAMFPALVDELRALTAIDPQYVQHGLLELAFSEREAEALARLARHRAAQGFRTHILSADEARSVEPGLSDELAGAALFEDDHAIDPVRFTAALAAAAQHRGATLRPATPATAFEVGGGRIQRVRLADGDWIAPAIVVIAAGVWSVELGRLLRVRVPVRPMRGEMLALRGGDDAARHTLVWDDGYLVPRAGGEIVVGSTSTYTDEQVVTSEGVATLLARAHRMVPQLATAPTTRQWAGLRPCATIRRPIIGPVRGFENLLLATGHHRAGILLAPITGQLIAELITHRATSVSLAPFAYRPR